ncbi:glycosyltransferase family 4 protein [Candidatus Peregrinibacteria bacterium]|jgi:glycosyltransferase involved in cell wall biosynthesis|nr:glycosyltransferase family 4 protein [Candidatus Peregrinibacteria bacterium]MBT7736309.1 glycosyltransferase family 4 protein [Candidatus Peregrinibacteria bacterium]
MKIGIDCRLYSSNFTGIGRYVHEIVDWFVKINNENKRENELVLFFNKPEYNDFIPPNLSVKKVLVNARHYSLAEQTKFLKILNKENCDIVHFPHFNVPILYKKPYVVTIHDLTLSFFPGQKMTKWFHRLAYNWTIKNAVKKAKKVVAVSENTKADIVENLKVPEAKIKVIHNGVSKFFQMLDDPKEAGSTLKKYGINKQFLLYTGVWRNHKNLPNLIKAFEIIKSRKEIDLQLVITGKEDPHYPEVRKEIKKSEFNEDVITPGLVKEEELLHLYNAALLYVFPSLYEGFGLPPLESMKCGTPVVASNTSCIPEVCGEKNAVFFDPYYPQKIADKIEHLYKDADLQAELVERGYQHANKFTWERSARTTYNILCSNHSNNS